MNTDFQMAFGADDNRTDPKFRTYLRQIADTTFGMTADDYARVLVMIGFEHLAEDAVGKERFHIYGRKSGGILLTFDTYHRQRNSASAQFRTNTMAAEGLGAMIEDLVELDGFSGTAHVRIDARNALLGALAAFEDHGGFFEIWGNRGEVSGVARLTLEQDVAVALREGISPRDIEAKLQEVSMSRVELLPKAWRELWDFDAKRTCAEAQDIWREPNFV